MGSFCEGVLAFEFRADAPAEVIAAFSVAFVGDEDAPALPDVSAFEYPGEVFDEFDPTAFAALSIGEQATVWADCFQGMETTYLPGSMHTLLRWQSFAPRTSIRGGVQAARPEPAGRWTLTTRFHQKGEVTEDLMLLLEPWATV